MVYLYKGLIGVAKLAIKFIVIIVIYFFNGNLMFHLNTLLFLRLH